MHYLLGRKLHETYWQGLFGGTVYEQQYNQSRFYVKSTNVNRTIESAASQVFGIMETLPPLTVSKEEVRFSSPPYPGAQAEVGKWKAM
jgi:hypothetical protein